MKIISSFWRMLTSNELARGKLATTVIQNTQSMNQRMVFCCMLCIHTPESFAHICYYCFDFFFLLLFFDEIRKSITTNLCICLLFDWVFFILFCFHTNFTEFVVCLFGSCFHFCLSFWAICLSHL